MIQFLVGSTTLNLDWLLEATFGIGAYNIPPMFFIGGIGLFLTGFYLRTMRVEAVRFIITVGLIGIVGVFVNGFEVFQVRQTAVYLVAVVIWLFLYQEGCQRDIFTLLNTHIILLLYLTYCVVVLSEHALFNSDFFLSVIANIFSTHPEGIATYLNAGRLSYFSNEPSLAAEAIPAIILPFLVANVIVNRTPAAYVLFGVALLILYFAEGLTSQAHIAFAIGFILMPRLSIIALPVLAMVIAVAVGSNLIVLTDSSLLSSVLWDIFGGIYSRIDSGLDSGSYISRLGGYFLSVKALFDAPLFGQGFGGTANYLFVLDRTGFDVLFTVEQEAILAREAIPHSGQMVMRIPGELGIFGALYIILRGFSIFRRALQPTGPDPMTHYAFRYIFGAMLLSFFFEGTLLNPLIASFVALLGQMRRRWGEAPQATPELALRDDALVTSRRRHAP